MKSSKRQRNPHTHDEQPEKTDFFTKADKQEQPGSSFFKAKPDIGSVSKKGSIQRLATPKEDENLGTNDARMAKDKEIQEKPIQRKAAVEEKDEMTKTNIPGIQRDADESAAETATESNTTNEITPAPQSCSGWEGDPQSFSKRAAEHFCKDAFNTVVPSPDSVVCSGSSCIVRYSIGVFSHSITVDLSRLPGMVFVSGSPSLILRSQTCSYSYSCENLGAISFTRIGCRFT